MPRRGAMLGASVAGIINADARSDQEAKRRVLKLFGSFLALLYILDMGSSFFVLCSQCRETSRSSSSGGPSDDASAPSSMAKCLRHSIRHGLVFSPIMTHHTNDSDKNSSMGDLFLLAVVRCVVTTFLLLLGVHYGQQRPKPSTSSNRTRASATDTAGPNTSSSSATGSTDPLTQPLLSTSEAATATTTTATLTTTSSEPDDNTTVSQQEVAPQAIQRAEERSDNEALGRLETQSRSCCDRLSCCTHSSKRRRISPAQAKNAILVVLFVTSTIYQVYAGLKVSTFDDATRTIIPFLCLTILWVNAQAYVFRTLLAELTREEGLFLPPEIHRHPMYLEQGRALSTHWCDLCRQRIGGAGTNSNSNTNTNTTTAGAGNNSNDDNNEGGCYRCSLCDFDICLKCARRNDAATVGENVLRGDRGVRAETAITTGGYVRRSLIIAKSELPLLIISFFLLASSSISQLLLPHFQGHIIDKVIPDDQGDYDKSGFFRFIRIYLGIMLAQGAISTLYSAIFTLVSRRLKFTIRNVLLEKIMAQDVAYFDGTETGRLISILTNDLDLMMAPIQSSLSSLLSNVLILIGGMVMCFVKSYRLSMLAFVTVGPISYLWQNYALWSKGLAREMLSYWAEGNGIASQALGHIRTVKSFGCEERVLQSYTDTNRQALQCGVKDAWGNGLTSALTGYLDLGSGVLILYFGGLLVYNGEMSVGELVTFQLFWNMMNNSYQSLQGLVTSFTRSAAGAEKVFSLWDSAPDIDPAKGNDVSWKVEGHLRLHNVSFYYQMRPDHKVLNQFDLDIPAGKTVALVGRSGGGKSTIINLLLRFYDAREGKITLDGRDYDSLKVNQLRSMFGVVTQETELFALTVEENIAYGLDKDSYTMDDVVNAAKKAHAHDFIVEMKDGYSTRIGERGGRLSGGQRQRLAIARVFLRRPRIILLDEATSALDEHSQEAVQKALADLITQSNATVVLVAHRLSTVVNADSICVIDKGSVLEQGNHEELVAKGGIYASMVDKQLKKKADIIDQEKEKGTAGLGGKDKQTVAADDIDALLDGN